MKRAVPLRYLALSFVIPFLLVALAFTWHNQQAAQAAAVANDTAVPSFDAGDLDFDDVDPVTLNCAIPDDLSDLLPCHANQVNDRLPAEDLAAMTRQDCILGSAGIYPCQNVNLLAFLPLADIGSVGGIEANDIWGWTDPLNGNEYAIVGLENATSFVDISDPENPVYLGKLPSHSGGFIWRDVKTYGNYALIVADSAGSHGMQVFDLTELRNVVSPPVVFSETAHYPGFGSAHNIVVNEESGFAYAVGVSSGSNQCNGGLHMIDVQDPLNPVFAGCYSGDGYTHDAQCVIYNGPDKDYQGREICVASNTNTVTIVDVTNKAEPVMIARKGYTGVGYTHQGWLTPDHNYFLLDDELDEGPENTRTYIWDVTDLDDPQNISTHESTVAAIDHNQYVHNNFSFQANYRAGLRILDLAQLADGILSEVAFFDVYPSSNSAQFNGSWSNYPYFPSGVVIVSGIEQGLFILEPWDLLTLGPDSEEYANQGGTLIHEFTLATYGMEGTYNLSISGNTWPTSIVGATSVNLTYGQGVVIQVAVTVPSSTGLTDSFTLTASGPTEAVLTADGISHSPTTGFTYLPIIAND